MHNSENFNIPEWTLRCTWFSSWFSWVRRCKLANGGSWVGGDGPGRVIPGRPQRYTPHESTFQSFRVAYSDHIRIILGAQCAHSRWTQLRNLAVSSSSPHDQPQSFSMPSSVAQWTGWLHEFVLSHLVGAEGPSSPSNIQGSSSPYPDILSIWLQIQEFCNVRRGFCLCPVIDIVPHAYCTLNIIRCTSQRIPFANFIS